MQFNKQAMEKELVSIVDNSSNEKDLRTKLIDFWDSKIKQAYNGNKDLTWFLNTLSSNNEKARRVFDDAENENNKQLRQNWALYTSNMFNNCANGADIDYLFKNIESGGSFDLFNTQTGDTALVFTIEDKDIVTASLIMVMARGENTVSFPSGGELFLKNNAMLTAFKSDPKFLKLLLAARPDNCYSLDNEHAVMHELNQIEQTENIRKNLEIYKEFTDTYTPPTEENAVSESFSKEADLVESTLTQKDGAVVIGDEIDFDSVDDFEPASIYNQQSQVFANAIQHAKGLGMNFGKFGSKESSEQNEKGQSKQAN